MGKIKEPTGLGCFLEAQRESSPLLTASRSQAHDPSPSSKPATASPTHLLSHRSDLLFFALLRLRTLMITLGLPAGNSGKEPACRCRRHKSCGFCPWVGKIPWKAMATYSRVLAWRIPWTEESGGVQSMGSQRIGHD